MVSSFLLIIVAGFLPGSFCVTFEEAQRRYCCCLPSEELEALRGRHPDCPAFGYGVIIRDGDKCEQCPLGTCRVLNDFHWSTSGCLCAGNFLDTDQRTWCSFLHDRQWPDSVGTENINLRSCATTTETPSSAPTCGKECVCGTFLPETCSCQCPPNFAGGTCELCNQNYFGTNCDICCDASETCSGVGVCSQDGRSCECIAGKFGSDCSCDAQDCASGDSCSGRGTCFGSECDCNAGFVGCSCELECDDGRTCSGNGRCRADATCSCDPGFVGADCATLDLSTCCSGPTVSGNPCLPGVIETLGCGYDALKGAPTMPVSLLFFKQGRTFTAKDNTCEIPDNVRCSPVTASDSGFKFDSFQSTLEHGRRLAGFAGLAGEFQSGSNSGYFSASLEHEDIFQKSFSQQRKLFTSDLNHGLCSCAPSEEEGGELAPAAARALETLSGNRLVQKIGTHYVKEVTFGGKLSVFNFVASCVFATETQQQVEAEIIASIFELAGGVAEEGSVGAAASGSCSLVRSNSFYLRSVSGGAREKLLALSGASSIADFRDWIDSTESAPSAVQLNVDHVDFIVDTMSEEIVQTCIDGIDPIESELSNEGEVACPALECDAVGKLQAVEALQLVAILFVCFAV